jgi:hypothetical protein
MKSGVQERFWSKVDKKGKNECWEWLTGKNWGGYGIFSIDRRKHAAHRVSWQINIGPIPKGKFVCHKCDNPGCVNPNHLFVGTHRENMQDMIRKGRAFRGYRINYHKLSSEQVEEIRLEYAQGSCRQVDLAHKHNISKTQIGRIVRGEDWPHIAGPITQRGSGNCPT